MTCEKQLCLDKINKFNNWRERDQGRFTRLNAYSWPCSAKE